MNLAHVLNIRRTLEESPCDDDAYKAIMHILDGQIENALIRLAPLDDQEIAMLKTNNTVKAIKMYRERTGAMLVEGKVVCDSYRARHHW